MRTSSELASSTFLRRLQSRLLPALAEAIASRPGPAAAFLINWAINVPFTDSFRAAANSAKIALPVLKTGQSQNQAQFNPSKRLKPDTIRLN
jgi:hypothetical protein